MTLRIGIVGAGANTRLQHIPGFAAIDGVEITAVCNSTRQSGQKAADEFDIPHVFDTWKELVHSDEVDAVCVGTWPYLHCPISLECLIVGKHILTEARMAMNLEEARQMYAAAQKSDRVAMIVPAPFYLVAEPILLRMLHDGAFGDLLEIQVRGLSGGYAPQAPLHWRQQRNLSGDNIMGMGIFNETVRRYAGDEKALMAHGTLFTAQRPTADGGSGTADIPESLGIVAQMQSGATAVYHISSVARLGDSFSFEFHGTKGAFKMDGGNAKNPGGVWVAGEGDKEYSALELPQVPRNGWRVEEDFVDAIRTGKPVTHTSFADGVKYMQFTEAVQRSMRQDAKIELPLG
jgi:predicted dehydrogenase